MRGFLDDEPRRSDLFDLDVIVHTETAKALLVSDTLDGEKVWVPKSQVEFEAVGRVKHADQKAVRVGRLTLPEWLAREKGLLE